jgi:hypothetical protein
VIAEKSKKSPLFCIWFLISLVAVVLISPVNAETTISFIDKAYFGENPVVISDDTGSVVFNGTTKSTGIELPSNHTYTIQFNPGGVTDVARSPDYGALVVVQWITQNIVGFIILVLVLYLLFGRK